MAASGTATAAAGRVDTAAAPAKPLRPAFRSDAQAAGFALLIAFALALPVLLAKVHPGGREYQYSAVREEDGAFSFVRHEIFHVKDDIDIVFAGNSTTWAGFDSPLVESALSRALGRRARVVTFGSYWPGLDVPYMEIHDALQHKRIGMVVLSVPRTEFNDGPSPVGVRFLSYSDPPDTRADLPLDYRMELYAGYVLRSPRDLLNWIRPIRPIPSGYAAHNGSMHADKGYEGAPFTRFVPPVPALDASRMIYSAATRGRFHFTGNGPPPYHVFYLRKLAKLLSAAHTRFVVVNLPIQDDGRSATAIERQCWPQLAGPSTILAGIPPATLFRGLTDAQIKLLYYDSVHLNSNGSEYVTRALLPALLDIYGGAYGGENRR